MTLRRLASGQGRFSSVRDHLIAGMSGPPGLRVAFSGLSFACTLLNCNRRPLLVPGHDQQNPGAVGVGAIANLALSFALAPRWGAAGVAVAYAFSMILWNAWAAVDLRLRTGLHATALANPAALLKEKP
ncbi:MAG TPA: hypothetical protein VG273_08800 [Bryobacteraceae bacterium]|nr:hypothetical protein [Bryobacteraceae bacterium]